MNSSYIIITPARNEGKYIINTIESVINQSVKPILWIIVNDNSTDQTSEIVEKFVKKYPFIRLIENSGSRDRNFNNKVYAIRNGFKIVENVDYKYYCNLDADVSFEPNYFEFLLKKFEENPKLGICGGRVCDLINGKFEAQKTGLHSVSGPVQFFRKECYESFGGYQPFKSGFVDGYAEISARMNGWETRTFPDLKVKHYRPTGTAKGSRLKIKYEGGKMEYRFGYSYSYHLLRALFRIKEKPFFLGTVSSLLGYISSFINNEKRPVPNDFISYVRKEQKTRLKNEFFKIRKRINNKS